MNDLYATNLLGALVVTLHDEMESATTDAADHSAACPAALATMLGEPGLSIESLRQILGLSHSGTVRLVDGLEREGSVERKAGKDARTVSLHLTAQGKKQARLVLDARRKALEPALDQLTIQERAQLIRLTEKVLAGLTRDRQHSDHICRLCDLSACPDDTCPVNCAALAAEA